MMLPLEPTNPSADRTAEDRTLSALSLGPISHIAHYSDIGEDTLQFDLSALRTFVEPTIPRSLIQGRNSCIKRFRTNTTYGHPIPLDGILEACDAHGTLSALREAHVVTWRGIIAKFMLGGKINVYMSLIDGTLYIFEVDPRPGKVYSGQLRTGYHGHAFEALCTEPDQTKPIRVDLHVWKCIVHRTLGDLNLVYGAEVDCSRGEYSDDSSSLMELKTLQMSASNSIPSDKRRKWYLQSRLMDIPEILVGYRDEDFVLQRTQSFSTEAIAPSTDSLRKASDNGREVLQTLRQACASFPLSSSADRNDAIWMATVHSGNVSNHRLLNKREVGELRSRAKGKRLGLLPADCVAKLRAQ